MKTILDKIIEHKKDELAATRSNKNNFKDTFSKKRGNVL